ncbi:O-antigen ligase family protein [Falsirhodobacter sp. 20TX0035]|uniref:O-antigen ligase family protein n=1 Tax=Falsirhodobacter sp. 20TX0035 TaxID=3022019 RepID=UPI00232C1774|nr:O-antigen ligase family protein [Falsirhodobacter sp. 20TX0035]MDB6453850.1 O-antigen ligase family protein [Falsirhodobacter sp. 20TX0035]
MLSDHATFPQPSPRVARRAVRRKGLTIPWAPEVVFSFLAILGLTLVSLLGAKGVLLFLLSGMALIVTNPDGTLRGMRREWLLIVMALWCLVSLAWSDYPALSLRYGIQLGLTVMIAIAICQRITPQALIKIVLLSYGIAGLLSLASGRARSGGMGFLGIYGSKNSLAFAMGVLLLVSLAVLLDRRMPRLWRGLALPGAGLGAMLMVMGNSTGALVAIAASIATLMPIMVLHRMKANARVVVIVLAAVLAVSMAVMLSTMADDLALAFLNTTGKDVTLTGRTDLWHVAFGEIMQRPFLGTGFQAFWVQGNPRAEELWAEFGISTRGGFNFHNTLISNAVEIGLVGVALQAVVFFSAVYFSLVWAVRSPSAASLFLALLMVREVMLMGVEVVFFFQFGVDTILMVAALYYGRNFRLMTGSRTMARI